VSGGVLTQRRRDAERSSWPRVRLGEVCEINTATPPLFCGVKPYVSTGAVIDGKIDSTQVEHWSYEERPSRANLFPSKGDVLFAKMQATRKTLIIDDVSYGSLFSTGFYALTPHTKEIDAKYLFHYLDSKEFLSAKDKECKGATQKALNNAGLNKLKIPLPPLADQRRIASTLDSICCIIEKRKDQLAQLQQLVKSRFVEMFGSMPNSTRMADVCSIITDGTHQSPKFVESGIPFLFVSNIVSNRLTYDAEKFIDEATYEELIKRTPIEIGDVLLSTVGSYGHPAIVNSNRKFLFQRHIAYLKPRKEIVDSQFLHGAILSAIVQEQIERRVKGIAQKTLNLSEVKRITLPLPPLALQREFAAFVAKVDKLAFAARRRRDLAQQMYRAKIQDFFG
jgi:type I restriction enzyme, S subunit